MTFARINNIDLYYETHGAGVPLLLVAGLASDSQSWGTVTPKLAGHCLAVPFDNRGVGRTSPQETPITIQGLADDCVALAQYLGWTTFNLLGHSMGGFVALDCAIRYPGYVDKLILAGTSSVSSQRNNMLMTDWAECLMTGTDRNMWFRNFFYWIFTPRFFENKNAVNIALQAALDYPYPQSPTAFGEQVKAISDFDCSRQLSGISAKTLVVGGKEDLLFPPETGAALAGAIPGAAFSLIANAAHAIHIEKPREFTDAVLRFLFPGS